MAIRNSSTPPGTQAKEAEIVSRKKIMVVDDHPMMRVGLVRIINQQPDLQVCAEAETPDEALGKISAARPDLAVIDLNLPGRSGMELIKGLLAVSPTLPILVLSTHDETIYAERVLRLGARGYLMKDASTEILLAAVRQVLAGQIYVSPAISARILGNFASRKPDGSRSPIERLSDREFEIFQLIGKGRSIGEIADELHLSPKTVDVHRSHIKEKLEAKDTTALARQAILWMESQSSGV